MITDRIPWRSPWPRLLPLVLLLTMPAAGQCLGWLMASPLGESVSLLPGWASWAVILATAALLTGWSGLLTNPSLRVETGAQMPGASLAFGAATLHAMSAQGVSKEFSGVAVFAYGLAVVWLCANAFGSEFDHRTMGQLLVQPRSRGRIYREKLGVAGSLAGLAAVIVFLTTSRSSAGDPQILGVTLGYLILGLVLPVALVWLGFSSESLNSAWGKPEWQPITVYATALAALMATSLYASSVSQSSMKAVALTPLLLASLWAIGALTVWAVVVTLDDQWGNLWLSLDPREMRDPALLNQKPPAWLPVRGTLQRMTEIGPVILGMIWIGFVVRSARVNAQRLRIGWPTVSRQWGRLCGGLWMASLLGGLLLVGLGRMRNTSDQLSSLRSMREGFIQLATQAEQEGRFTPEYLSQYGITNRPSPEELVDELIRLEGFQSLSLGFGRHFQRRPVVASNPRLLMDPRLARRYGLQTQPGTMTPPGTAMPSTNPASPEPATSAPATTTKASTNLPANPAPGQ